MQSTPPNLQPPSTEPGSARSIPVSTGISDVQDRNLPTPRDPSNIRMADHIDRNDITDLMDFREGLVFPPVNQVMPLLRSGGGAGSSRAVEHEDPVSLGMLSLVEANHLVQR
jgi:hypothetical protein